MRDEEFRCTATRFARFFAESIPDPWTVHRKGIEREKHHGNKKIELVGTFDKEMEQCYIKFLAEYFPGEHVVSEETKHDWPPTDDVFWIIDPCDGTHNMLYGIPCFGTMAARVEHGVVTFAALYLPARMLYRESGCYVASRGHGAWEWRADQSRRLAVSTHDALDTSSIFFEGSYTDVVQSPLPQLLNQCVQRMRKISASCWTGLLVASGKDAIISCDAAVTIASNAWDILPIALLITEAGGMVTDYAGQPLSLSNYAYMVMSNGLIHDALIAVIRSRGLCSGH